LLSLFNFRNRRTTQPKLQRSALVICLTFMALFAYSTSNVLAASATPNNVATAGTTVITRPIDAPLFVTTDCSMVIEIPTSECDVLVALYTNTNGSGWTTHINWNVTNTPCSWSGIYCNGSHVAEIYLGTNNLSGALPSLSGLANLASVNLYNNNLSGTIPSFSGLTNLQILNLFGNTLSGTIPSFSGLTYLQILNLSSNKLSGTIPSFSGLTNLQGLYLSSNNLSGTIPSFSGLTYLQGLYLSSNNLSGTIPSFSGLTNLQP